jgi:hypothetical protein
VRELGGGSEAGGTVDFVGRVIWSNARRLWDVGMEGSQVAGPVLICVVMVHQNLLQFPVPIHRHPGLLLCSGIGHVSGDYGV